MQRVAGLDFLRALAIAWVILFHAQGAGLSGPVATVSQYGWMGVDLFFVLSGYLIGWQLLKPLSQGQTPSLRTFYIKRACRILPAYWVVLVMYMLLPSWREAPSLQAPWQFLSFTLNLTIDYFHNRAFSHAWSLCVEEHFYLLLPAIAIMLARKPSAAKLVGVCAFILIGGMALRASIWQYLQLPLADDSNGGGFVFRYVEEIYYPTYNRLDGLMMGVLLATVKAYRPLLWETLLRHAKGLLLLGLLGMMASFWIFQERFSYSAAVVGYPLLSLSLALLVAAMSSPKHGLGWFTLPGAGWIALCSYSLYLSHKLMFNLVKNTWQAELQGHGLLTFIAYASAALLGAAVLHYAVERPGLRLRRRWLERQAPRDAEPARA